MAEEKDPLSELWQTQVTEDIDVNAVKRDLQKQKWKHILYTFFDALGCVPLIILFVYFRDEFSLTALIGMAVFGLVALIYFVYFTWLRRHAILGVSESTSNYTRTLMLQYKNNRKIASLTMHSCWIVMIMLFCFFGAIYLAGEFPTDGIGRRILAIGMTGVFMAGVGRWAYKRKQFFDAKYQRLKEYTDRAGMG